MKSIILCADDFAYNPAISRSILKLIKQERISATSCMANMPGWPAAAQELKAFDQKVDIGLHFNLTEGPSLSGFSFMPLKRLLIFSNLRLLNQQKIYTELCAQLDEFKNQFGRLPDFIDGHQHIHQLPIVRDALLRAYKKYFPEKKVYIRLSSNGFSWQLKSLIINLSGALNLKRQLIKLKIPHNSSFAGIYNLKPHKNYAQTFQGFIDEIKNQGLIMCHPANQSHDEIGPARQQEFDFFSGADFAAVLENIKLTRF